MPCSLVGLIFLASDTHTHLCLWPGNMHIKRMEVKLLNSRQHRKSDCDHADRTKVLRLTVFRFTSSVIMS